MTKTTLKEAKRIVAEAVEKDRQRRKEREERKERKMEEARQQHREAVLTQIEPYENMDLPVPPDPFNPQERMIILAEAYKERDTIRSTERAYAVHALKHLEDQVFNQIVPDSIHRVDPDVPSRIRSIIRGHLIRHYPRLGRGASVRLRSDAEWDDGN